VERLLYLLLKELNERLNLRKLRGLRLNRGTTMLFLENFLHNKEDTMRKKETFRKIQISKNCFKSAYYT